MVGLRVAKVPSAQHAGCLGQFAELIERQNSISTRRIVAAANTGSEGDQIWFACPPIDATPLRELVLNKGRLAGDAVLEIARQLAAVLAEFEAAQVVHGDISATAVSIASDGTIRLCHSGVRGILRPDERFAHAELPPDAYDGIAPERVADAAAPTVASDMFACGRLWWHLLAGRPPLAGGTSLAKLPAAQAATIADAPRFAPH